MATAIFARTAHIQDRFDSLCPVLNKGNIFLNILYKNDKELIGRYYESFKLKILDELEFVKGFQQDIIADMEIITSVDVSKKSLPRIISERDRKKEESPFKI